jgi:hypothetical protein
MIETSTEATPAPPAPVRFGPGPDQTMPHSWAEAMLTILATENTRVFTQLIGRVSLNGAGH